MKKNHPTFPSFLVLVLLTGLLTLSSCAGFKLVSQRPASIKAVTTPVTTDTQTTEVKDETPEVDAVSAASEY